LQQVFIIELFYQFFQGILLFQALFFGIIYTLTRRRELLIYALMIATTTLYFFLNAPDTFFNLDADQIFRSTAYSIVNFFLLLVLMFFYLLFLQQMFPKTSSKKVATYIFKLTIYSIPVLYLLYLACLYFNIPNDYVFYTAHLLNGPFCTYVLIDNWKTRGDQRLLIYGLIVTFIFLVVTLIMTVRYNQGHSAYYIDKYPLVYIRISMLIDILLFQIYLMRHWVNQEKELATKEIKNQLNLAQFKNQVNNALHDDIGTILSKINLRSFMAIQKIDSPDFDAKANFVSIQTDVQNLMEKIKNILSQDIHTGNFTWEEEVVQYAQDMCEFKNIKLTTSQAFTKPLPLSADHRYQMVLILKEAINNAVKYSACTKIEIKITEQEGKISVIITDNGKGFNLNEISGGSGLKNMKTRAEKIHCQLTITSGPLLGTEIKLEQKNKI
jgi:signal transduction histidine kinase